MTTNDIKGGMIRTYMLALASAIAVFLLYLPALKNGFVNLDDPYYVYNNLNIRILDSEFIKWAFTTTDLHNWHPLTLISHAIDFSIWGLNPKGYHLTNNILHSLNVLLVFLLCSRFCSIVSNRGQTNTNANNRNQYLLLMAPLVTALLFGLHPLRVESVAWISERTDVLSAFFYLLAVYCYTGYGQNNCKAHYILALLFSLLAIMSKPMAVSIPVILLLIDWYPLERLKNTSIKKILIEKIPFFALSLFIAVATLSAQSGGGAARTADLGLRLLVALRGYGFYIYKFFLPANLTPIYPYPENVNFITLEYSGSIALFIIITIIALLLAVRTRKYLAVWLCYLFILFPVIGIVQSGTQAAADRFSYLSFIAPTMLLGLLANSIFSRVEKKELRTIIIIGLIVIAAFLSFQTRKQISIWKDSLTLWNHQIALYPEESVLAYINRGDEYRELGRYDEAIKDLNVAVRIAAPDDTVVYNERGMVYLVAGRYSEAIKDFTKAILINPELSGAYTRRGIALMALNKPNRALLDFDRAITVSPENQNAYLQRGAALFVLGDIKGAIAEYTTTIKLAPRFTDAYLARGSAEYRLGNYRKAIKDYQFALKLEPDHGLLHFNIAKAYELTNEREKAQGHFKKALSLGVTEAGGHIR